jgi:hypothetical protein
MKRGKIEEAEGGEEGEKGGEEEENMLKTYFSKVKRLN